MELPNRAHYDADFATALSSLSDKHRAELVKLLGTPPSLANVPSSFWIRVKREQDEELAALLLLLFLVSSKIHGYDGDTTFARLWSAQHAHEIADSYTQTSIDRTVRLAAEWASQETLQGVAGGTVAADVATQRLIANGVSATRASQLVNQAVVVGSIARSVHAGEVSVTAACEALAGLGLSPTRIDSILAEAKTTGRLAGYTTADVDEQLNRVFGPERSGRLAGDVVTRAQTAGGEFAVGQTVGLSPGDMWLCHPERSATGVCQVCLPFDGKPRHMWAGRYPAGPPIHGNCQCEVRYHNLVLEPELV